MDNWAVSPRGAGWLFGPKVPLQALPQLCALLGFITILFGIGDERVHCDQQSEADLSGSPACPRGGLILILVKTWKRFYEITSPFYWATNEPRLVNSVLNTLFFQGYKYMFDDSLVTVWSAPNYCYRSASFLNRVSSYSVDFQMWQHRFNSAVFRRGQPHTETL